MDVFNNLSAPYFLAEGSLLNFHRNFSAGKADVDFSLELEWWKQSDHKSQLAALLTKKGLWQFDTFGEFGEVLIISSISTNFKKGCGSFQNGYEEKWQRDGVSVDIFSSVVANGKHTLAVWIEAKPYFCSYQFEGWRIILTCLSPRPM